MRGGILRLVALPDEHSEVVRGCTELDQFPLSELEVTFQFLIIRLLFNQKYQVFKDLGRSHHPFMKLPAATVIRPVVTMFHSCPPPPMVKSVMQDLQRRRSLVRFRSPSGKA